MTPARKHFLRVTAALAAAPTGSEVKAHATGYELMLAKLHNDRRHLKTFESQAAKIELKRKLLPDYVPWVEGALQGGGAQDDVLMTVMVWRIDAGEWQGALDIAAYALHHRLLLPDQFGRNLPCLVAEELADQAQRGEAVPLAILQAADTLLAEKDMPDQVRAKLAKAIAYAASKEAETAAADTVPGLKELALTQFQRALKLHDKCGVKQDMQRLEKELKNLAKPADPADPG